MKRAFLFVLVVACHPKTNANANADAGPTPIASTSSSAGEDEEEDALLAQVLDGGACPKRVHPDYCRNGCRNFANRKAGKHARRVSRPERLAFGKCDTFDVFAEDEEAGDGGVAKGIVEYFDPTGSLVGAVDTRLHGCTQFGHVPTCAPQLEWEQSHAFAMTLGPVESTRGLPQEVISRIVRQNFGRFKMCAQNAKDPRPVGRYGAKVHVAKDGSVSSVDDDGTTLASHELSACLAKSFSSMSFPQPEGGPMTARVSLVFAR